MAERYPNLKEEVGGSVPGCEISSLLDIKLAKLSTDSYALAMACRPSVPQKRGNLKYTFVDLIYNPPSINVTPISVNPL